MFICSLFETTDKGKTKNAMRERSQKGLSIDESWWPGEVGWNRGWKSKSEGSISIPDAFLMLSPSFLNHVFCLLRTKAITNKSDDKQKKESKSFRLVSPTLAFMFPKIPTVLTLWYGIIKILHWKDNFIISLFLICRIFWRMINVQSYIGFWWSAYWLGDSLDLVTWWTCSPHHGSVAVCHHTASWQSYWLEFLCCTFLLHDLFI